MVGRIEGRRRRANILGSMRRFIYFSLLREKVHTLLMIFGTKHPLNLRSFGAKSFIHLSVIVLGGPRGVLKQATIVEIARPIKLAH